MLCSLSATNTYGVSCLASEFGKRSGGTNLLWPSQFFNCKMIYKPFYSADFLIFCLMQGCRSGQTGEIKALVTYVCAGSNPVPCIF